MQRITIDCEEDDFLTSWHILNHFLSEEFIDLHLLGIEVII